MNKPSIILSFLFSLLLISCESKTSTEDAEFAQLKKEVIAVHDDAMAKMGNIMKLKKELNAKKETLTDADSSAQIDQTITELTQAHDGMMNWMRSFSQNFPVGFLVEGMDHGKERESEEMVQEDLYQNLEDELVKIQDVDIQMNEAIENAESILNQ